MNGSKKIFDFNVVRFLIMYEVSKSFSKQYLTTGELSGKAFLHPGLSETIMESYRHVMTIPIYQDK